MPSPNERDIARPGPKQSFIHTRLGPISVPSLSLIY